MRSLRQLPQIRSLRILAGTIALLTAVLVALGAFVRATGAGLACPDWPLCFGQAVPEFTDGVTQEVLHRYLAAVVGVLTLALAYEAFALRSEFPRMWWFAVMMIVLLGVQVIFGGLTVTMKLNPFVVTTHLGLGTLFFQGMALTAIQRVPDTAPKREAAWSRPYRNLIGALAILTFFQMLLGAYVGSSGAALACPDIPACFGRYLPRAEFPGQVLHMAHRGVGLLILFGVVVAVLRARLETRYRERRMGHLWGILAMTCGQIALGVTNVVALLPLWGTLLHLVVAQMIFLALVTYFCEMTPSMQLFRIGLSRVQVAGFSSYRDVPRSGEYGRKQIANG